MARWAGLGWVGELPGTHRPPALDQPRLLGGEPLPAVASPGLVWSSVSFRARGGSPRGDDVQSPPVRSVHQRAQVSASRVPQGTLPRTSNRDHPEPGEPPLGACSLQALF